jgi:predicted O-methyltransferase YrrM
MRLSKSRKVQIYQHINFKSQIPSLMTDLLPFEIEDYCEAHTSAESELLYELRRETHLKSLRPRMLSGILQGTFLTMLAKLMKARYILEIGTYTGYAALCMAESLPEDGELHTIEVDLEQEDFIRKYFDKSPKKEQITLHIGEALKIIPTLDKPWDLVMIDADKREYIAYYDMILPKLRKGGIIFIDNVLWSGKVIEEVKSNDKDTQAIIAFNDHVQCDFTVRNVMLPFRDGMMMVEKVGN